MITKPFISVGVVLSVEDGPAEYLDVVVHPVEHGRALMFTRPKYGPGVFKFRVRVEIHEEGKPVRIELTDEAWLRLGVGSELRGVMLP